MVGLASQLIQMFVNPDNTLPAIRPGGRVEDARL